MHSNSNAYGNSNSNRIAKVAVVVVVIAFKQSRINNSFTIKSGLLFRRNDGIQGKLALQRVLISLDLPF